MKPNVHYRISSLPCLVFKRKADAVETAAGACLLHRKPQVIMTVRGCNSVERYEFIHTEEMADLCMANNTLAILNVPKPPTSIRAVMRSVRRAERP